MTTTIECALDAGRVQFTATVDDENKWKFSNTAPQAIVDNLIPDFKRSGGMISPELAGVQFDHPSQRYAARVIERLRHLFSSMKVAEPKKRGRKPRQTSSGKTS